MKVPVDPLVSIITPTFNHEKYIEKCIKSVVAQTYAHWELIIIDDHSTDRTYEIISKWSKQYPQIRIARHGHRWGIPRLADTYNQALHLARGKLIAILEGDDWWPKDKLKVQVPVFNNPEVILSFGDWVTTTAEGIPALIGHYKRSKYMSNVPLGIITQLFMDLNFYIMPLTVMIRKDALLSIGGFRKDIYYPFVDVPTWLRLSLVGKFSYVPAILGFYRKQRHSSWFEYAKKTNAMGRNELKKSIRKHIERYRNVFEANDIKLDMDYWEQKQQTQLNKKSALKDLSLIKQQFLFGDFKSLVSTVNEVLHSSVDWRTKASALLLTSIYITRPLVFVHYLMNLVRYRLRREDLSS